ncbi:MAG: hypothetical protein ACYTG2_02180 [Planctomycetota bacterium]
MKRRKVGPIGIVVADGVLRATQRSDRGLIHATAAIGDSLKKDFRQLLSAAPFVGRRVVLGLEGSAVLVESFALPAGASKDVRKLCQDRLKGDPLFDPEKAQLGVVVESVSGEQAANGPTVAIMAAMNRQRLADLMKVCRESEIDVIAVEAAALAAWRSWPAEGFHCRLVVSGDSAAVLAGHDETLQFCRIIEAPVQPEELCATLARASTLLGVDPITSLEATGLDPDLRAVLADAAGVEIEPPSEELDDVASAGLATPGEAKADFTPPEERILREKRRVRRAGIGMAASFGVLVLGVGLLGAGKLSNLEDELTLLEQRRDIVRANKAELDHIKAELAREQANEATIADARPGHRLSTLFALIASSASDSISFETVKVDDVRDPMARSSRDESGPIARIIEIRMNGLARTGPAVRQFTDALFATGAFEDVRVEASERVLLGVGIEGERFRIYAKAETH